MTLTQPNGPSAVRTATGAGPPRPTLRGGGLLLSDARIALMLCNEARYRVLTGLFGLPRDQANLATLIAGLTLAQAIGDSRRRLLAPGAGPTTADGVIGGAAVKELLCGVAGPAARETPLLGTLMTIAVVGGAAARVASKTGHAIRSSSHDADVRFHHRYGYLIDPGHWRQRRADRRDARASAE